MNRDTKELLAEVAASLKALWIYGKNGEYHACACLMFASYADTMLNYRKGARQWREDFDKLDSLRSELRAHLRAVSWRIVRVKDGWVAQKDIKEVSV